MPKRVLDGRKAAIGCRPSRTLAVLAAMRVTLFRSAYPLRWRLTETPEERRAVKFAALLRDEYKVACILPRLALFEPRIQDTRVTESNG